MKGLYFNIGSTNDLVLGFRSLSLAQKIDSTTNIRIETNTYKL